VLYDWAHARGGHLESSILFGEVELCRKRGGKTTELCLTLSWAEKLDIPSGVGKDDRACWGRVQATENVERGSRKDEGPG